MKLVLLWHLLWLLCFLGLDKFWFWCAGPGCSSLGVGAFSENGPFRPSGEVLVRNEYSWNRGMYYFGVCCFHLWVVSDQSNWLCWVDIVIGLICRSKHALLGDTNWSWVLLLNWYRILWVCKWPNHRYYFPFFCLCKSKVILLTCSAFEFSSKIFPESTSLAR